MDLVFGQPRVALHERSPRWHGNPGTAVFPVIQADEREDWKSERR